MEFITETERITLIKGEFTKHEAKEILLGMLNYKINFHELRDFSAFVQQGEHDALSMKRIHELEESRAQLIEFLSRVNDSGKLKITSKVIIEHAQ